MFSLVNGLGSSRHHAAAQEHNHSKNWALTSLGSSRYTQSTSQVVYLSDVQECREKNMKRFVALQLVSWIAAAALFAQIQAGRIVGTVYDPNKAVIPNAKVLITNTQTNQTQTLTSNGDGDFVLTPANPGFYKVVITASGFGTAEVNQVEVVVGQSARVDVSLNIGETSTKIEVSATTPLLNTESGTLGQQVTNQQIVDLPLNGRSFYELARLTPGATLLPGTGNLLRIRANFESGTSISGVRGSQTSFYMDGVDTTDHHQGGTLIQVSIDALQEFSIQQSEYSAEFRNAGGVLNGSTKSGTNEFHGVLFEFLRNDKLDGRNFFALQRDVLKRNQFGGGIGGPLSIPKVYNGKNRTFFFINYEAMRQRAGQVFNSLVPSPAQKLGDFPHVAHRVLNEREAIFHSLRLDALGMIHGDEVRLERA